MKTFWTRRIYGVLCLALLASTYGCSDQKSEADARERALAKAEHVLEGAKEIETFKKTQPFTLRCAGKYSLTVEGKTSAGTQSFGITFDPHKYVAYYFDFDADGYFDSGQKAHNHEVRAIGSVDAEWISMDSYRFNRSTLKYSYKGGLADGLCKRSDNIVDIPNRQI